MLSVFHTVAPDLKSMTFHVRIDKIGLGGYRTRWNRTSYSLPGLKSRIHASRVQLITLFGDEFYALVWQELMDLECRLLDTIRALEHIQACDVVDRLASVVFHPEEPTES
jgi:hypothetical protein